MAKPEKSTPRESFDPKKVKRMKTQKAATEAEAQANRAEGKPRRRISDGRIRH